jgi:hypothetical protein
VTVRQRVPQAGRGADLAHGKAKTGDFWHIGCLRHANQLFWHVFDHPDG